MTGLPRLPEPSFQRAVPTTPADRASARVDCFPARTAFPKWPEGRHPHCHFRGLLRLHSRYGPSDRSAAQGDLCHEAPAPAGYPAEPLVSYRINRQFSGWNLPPQMFRAFGAHGQQATSSRSRPAGGAPLRKVGGAPLGSSAAAVDDEFDACHVGGVVEVKECHVSWPGEFGISRKFLGVGN